MTAVVVGLLASVWFTMPEPSKKISQGDVAIAVSLPDLQGKMHGLSEGSVVLLHFWATWCFPCREEIPSLNLLHEKYKDKGLKILAVSTDQNAVDIQNFMQEFNINFTVVHDADMAVANRYAVSGYPETFVIDREGVVRAHIIGPAEWGGAEMQQQLEYLMQQTPKAMSAAAVRQPGG